MSLGWSDLVCAQGSTTPSDAPVSLYGIVPQDATSIEGTASAQPAIASAVDSTHEPKRGEFVVAPLPMINPTLGNGLFLVAGYLYRVDLADETTPPSATGIGGFKTSNGSWAAAALQSLHLAHDKVRLTGVFAYSDINYAFYGIGQSAGDEGISIDLNQTGPIAMVEGLVRLRPRWYIGARYQILTMAVSTASVSIPGAPALPGVDADLRTAALGPRFEYDSRDSAFYPRRGRQVQGIASFYGKLFGGRRSYQAYQAWVNGYEAIGARNVFAWHAAACGVDGSAPFYDLCMLGKSQDLRGYPTGQYRDRAMVAAQAEWRSELWWRFGGTAFLGAGEVVPDFGSLTWNDVLPGAGVGLRFTLAKRNHVNLRVDYAWGRNSTALYMSVAEAF